ncbi:MAG TPA: EVE domain-containing protein [Candidatus Paceibacterota bacterium]|jgi:predicted RNA-binding protein with PUA-like domain|nr:EVE domain-containing protein [Candidatus Paceibacterota bacterium]
MKNYWLLKSEPDAYSIDQLKKDKREPWSGVRNYQARNFMMQMHAGDECVFYHTGDERQAVGLAKVVGKPYPDPTQFDAKGHYFDPKATKENPRWWLVDVAFVKKFKRPVTLTQVKHDPVLRNMMLAHAGRLSVQPVEKKHFDYLVKLAS